MAPGLKNTATPHSDIDLAISTGSPIPLDRMNQFIDAIDALPTLYQVDVVDLNDVGPRLRQDILQHGEQL